MRHPVAAAAAVGLTTLLLSACSASKATSPSATPTTQDAAVVANGVEVALESSIASFLGGVAPPVQSFSRASAARVPYLRLAHVPLLMTRAARIGHHTMVNTRDVPPCVTETPSDPTDTDGDGIADTVTMTATPSCTFGDSTTFSVSGSLIMGDPTPSTPDADYQATLDKFTIGFSSDGDSATIALNGTTSVTETSGSLSQSNLMTLSVVAMGVDTLSASFAQNWMGTFTYTGSTLLGNESLPAGTLNFTGTTNYSGMGKVFALAVSTPTPLTYDPSCSTGSQITAGVMQATFSGTNGTAYVTLTWDGCQDPTIDFVQPN